MNYRVLCILAGLLPIVLLTNLRTFSQPGEGVYHECTYDGIVKNFTKTEVYIPMRDGVRLFTSFYVPVDTTRSYPILLYRTPYNVEPWGADRYNDLIQYYCRFAQGEYIMAFQDVRGKFMSEGEFEDIRPFLPLKQTDQDIDEASDTYDGVDWLVRNVPHNNGKVGVYGISYPGFYSTMAILSAHPAIRAVSPQAPVTNWFIGDDFHHNGAAFILDAFTFFYTFGQKREAPTRKFPQRFEMPVADSYEFMMEQGPLSALKAKYFDDSNQFFNDAYSHPDYDEFWRSRDPRPYLVNVGPAVMTVGGWNDAEDLWGTLHTYEAIEIQNPSSHPNILVMGPWAHAQWGSGTAENLGNEYWGQDANALFHKLEVEFFDYYLRGEGKGEFSEATIFITGENRWENFNSWPPANTILKDLYLLPYGKLGFVAPITASSFDEYISDPDKPVPYTDAIIQDRSAEYMTEDQRFTSKRPDVLVFKTDTLEEDVTFTGPLNVRLFVSTTGTDADFVVKLIDVYPEYARSNSEQTRRGVEMGGYQMLIRGEVMRGKYRDNYEKPVPFVPLDITEVSFGMNDIAHTFKRGHCIIVQVQSSWFPLVDRNPQTFTNIYTCTGEDFRKAYVRIYHDKEHPSRIEGLILKPQ